jgi:hypothetical protein
MKAIKNEVKKELISGSGKNKYSCADQGNTDKMTCNTVKI